MDHLEQTSVALGDRFARPSDLFRWCLRNVTNEVRGISYRNCFAYYLAAAEQDGYLWRQYDRRLEDLVANLRPGMKVLEVGSGLGHDLYWTALKGADAFGIDVKSEMVALSIQMKAQLDQEFGQSVKANFRHINLLDLDDADKFDFIYMKETLHHLEPRKDVVRKLASLLAPGGRILILEPNAWNPLIQLQMFRVRGFRTIVNKTDSETGESFVYGNERLLTGRTMIRLFRRVGVDGRTHAFRVLPTKLANRARLVGLANAIERRRLEPLLPVLPIHTAYFGRKAA